jgi:predicted nucleotidyltransferase
MSDQTTSQPGTILPDQFLNDVVGVFKDHLGPDLIAIVLYGSWARGETRPGSDVDLLVIARNLPRDRFERVTYVHRLVVGRFRRPISVLAKEPVEFEGYFPPCIWTSAWTESSCTIAKGTWPASWPASVRSSKKRASTGCAVTAS